MQLPHLVSDVFEVSLEVLLCTVQEPLRLQVGRAEGQKVDGRESGLLARRDEHNDRHLGRVLADGLVHWLHHGYQSGRRVSDVETLREGRAEKKESANEIYIYVLHIVNDI